MSASLTKDQSDKMRCWEKKHGGIEPHIRPNSPIIVHGDPCVKMHSSGLTIIIECDECE